VGKPVWAGERLYFLLTETIEELHNRYPEYTKNTLKGKKAYWKRKVTNGEIEMPPRPTTENFGEVLKLHNLSPDLAKEFTDQGFHVGYIKNKEGEIEYTIPLPRARTNKINIEEFPPAVPARITPSRVKPQERDYKSIYVFSDAQIDYRRQDDGTLEPLHDEKALAVGRLICRDVQPDLIVNLGDMVDLSSLSKFDADSDHFYRTLGPSFQRAHDYYAELRADNPNAQIVEVDSNHNTRLTRFIKNKAPALYGLKRAGKEDEYPVMTYPFLANLGHLGVKWISGYPAAEYPYGEEYGKPPIIFKHGHSVVSGGSTAMKESRENPENHVVRGHSHRQETIWRTTRAGNYLASIVVGVSCRITGEVPGYNTAVSDENKVVKYQENHQQGVLVIKDYDGNYEFTQIPINKGKAFYNGKVYEV